MIKKQKRVKIKNAGKTFTLYKNWITKNFPTYVKKWKPHTLPDENIIYREIGTAPHGDYKYKTISLISTMNSKQVFIIGVEGLKDAE